MASGDSPMFWLTFRRLAAVVEASQHREHPDEFVLALFTPPPGADFAPEIRDRAVCQAFAKHGEQSVNSGPPSLSADRNLLRPAAAEAAGRTLRDNRSAVVLRLPRVGRPW